MYIKAPKMPSGTLCRAPEKFCSGFSKKLLRNLCRLRVCIS